MYYNSNYRTKNIKNQPRVKTANPKERLINMQKREKLKNLLITKFMTKYNIKNKDYLENEIAQFLQGEKLNDADLQRLDNKIKKFLSNSKAHERLTNELTNNNQNEENIYNVNNNNNFRQANIVADESNPNEIQATTPKRPVPQSAIPGKKKPLKYKSIDEELAELEAKEAEYQASVKKPERIELSQNGDEWLEIAKYNKIQYEQELLEEKLKDKELKNQMKEALDEQVKEKIKKEYEEELKEKEYDKKMKEHSKKLDEIDRKKEEEAKQQKLKEKKLRDEQLADKNKRRRIEELKNKQFDRKTVNNILHELQLEKEAAKKNKKEQFEALKQTLKDNELRKKKLEEQAKKERLDDIKCMEEYAQTEIKKENERKLYFKRIERNANNFMTGVAKEALDKQERENKEEEAKMIFYQKEKDKWEQAKEDREAAERERNKKELAKYYDMQIEERKKNDVIEKAIDSAQAEILRKDYEIGMENERIVNEKIKKMNKNNYEKQMKQLEEKRNKEKNKNKMTRDEFNMNRDLISNAKRALANQK